MRQRQVVEMVFRNGVYDYGYIKQRVAELCGEPIPDDDLKGILSDLEEAGTIVNFSVNEWRRPRGHTPLEHERKRADSYYQIAWNATEHIVEQNKTIASLKEELKRIKKGFRHVPKSSSYQKEREAGARSVCRENMKFIAEHDDFFKDAPPQIKWNLIDFTKNLFKALGGEQGEEEAWNMVKDIEILKEARRIEQRD